MGTAISHVIRVGPPPYSGMHAILGAPPSGRWVMVCETFRDEGVAPTRGMPAICRSPAPGAMGGGLRGFSRRGRRSYMGNACYLSEPRPRGDGSWSARLFATRASLLQVECLSFVGAPPPGRWVLVCKAFRDEGVAPTGKCLLFVGAPPPGRCVVVCEAFRDEGVAPTGECLPFVGAPPSVRWVVVCEALRDVGVAPTRGMPAICRSPAPGAMGRGLRGASTGWAARPLNSGLQACEGIKNSRLMRSPSTFTRSRNWVR